MNAKEFANMKRDDFERYFWKCMDSPDASAEEIENLVAELHRRNKIAYATSYLCDARDGYYVDEMIDAVIKYGDFIHATQCVEEAYKNNYAPDRFEELFDLFISGPLLIPKYDWLMHYNYSGNIKIKMQMIENNDVGGLYSYLTNPLQANLYPDIPSKDDFYDHFYTDMPKEIQLGIMV